MGNSTDVEQRLEILRKLHKELMKECYSLHATDRNKSNEKMDEAKEVLKEIEQLEKQV